MKMKDDTLSSSLKLMQEEQAGLKQKNKVRVGGMQGDLIHRNRSRKTR